MTYCDFRLRLNRYVIRVVFLCFIIFNFFSLRDDGAIAQTLTPDLKNNSTQELFDPNGYYFPVGADFIIDGWRIEWIDIQTLNHHDDNEFQNGSSRSILPIVRLTITRQKDQKKFSYKCANSVVSPEVLTVSCPKTAIGVVSIQGSFIDKRGQFWNREDILPRETIVLNATVAVENKLGHRFSRQLSFTYWEGD